jgi:hypothetical protein
MRYEIKRLPDNLTSFRLRQILSGEELLEWALELGPDDPIAPQYRVEEICLTPLDGCNVSIGLIENMNTIVYSVQTDIPTL